MNNCDLFVTVDPSTIMQTPDTLNITTPHTSIPMNKTLYIIQAKINGKWQDVIFHRGCTPEKKARHYRNKYGVETRVVRIIEHCIYSYEYELGNTYKPGHMDTI